MEIYGNVEFLSSREEGPVGLVVIEMALVVIVDQSPDEAELLHTSRQLIRGGRRIHHRNGCPTVKPGRMLLNCRCQNIVGILAFRKIVSTGTNRYDSTPMTVLERYTLASTINCELIIEMNGSTKAAVFSWRAVHSLLRNPALVHFL